MRDLYAFSTSEGNFRFTARLPMGDKNIPVYFNNILREILRDIEQAKPYFDDILIGADDPLEFIDVVDKVLTRLKERNGVVSKDKIRLGLERWWPWDSMWGCMSTVQNMR